MGTRSDKMRSNGMLNTGVHSGIYVWGFSRWQFPVQWALFDIVEEFLFYSVDSILTSGDRLVV